MPVLTTIDDAVSLRVRDQYEQHPYPQWVKTVFAGEPQFVDEYIRQTFPHSPLVEPVPTGAVDLLVAGCGTGQHSIETALQFKDAQVLAVDLSLASLSYAQRQTAALGLNTIHYAQADLMKLPSLGRTFDVIESIGVLHHLADPWAGWRALISILRPGGLMRLGLYSDIARAMFSAAREVVATQGHGRTDDDIRRFRQRVFDSDDGAPLKNVLLARDFFSLSECRDLLFHAQEHRVTLPEIAAFMADNGLRFIGFELDLQSKRNYAQQFPDDVAMTELTQWHRYEIDNPRTFLGMYQFWVQKV
jgi:SAM-dependent methyltransferase